MHGSGYAKEQQQIIKNAIDEEEQQMMTNFPWIKAKLSESSILLIISADHHQSGEFVRL